MATATLTFMLPEEAEEHMDALRGGFYRGALESLREAIRSKRKYGDLTEEARAAYDELWRIYHELTEGLLT